MKPIFKTTITLFSLLILLSHAEASPTEPAESTTSPESGVVVRVGKAIERGARVTANWIEHGVRATGNGIEHGAKATANGIKHGVKATANGVAHGAKATENAANHVANKIGKSPASSPVTD